MTSIGSCRRSTALFEPPVLRVRRGGEIIASVWVLAFAVRCLYLWQISHAPFFELRLGDAEAYHAWALRIAAGDWLGHGVFYQAPLYPYFLAILYRLFGDSVIIVRVVQAAIGATSCALVAAAAVSIAGERRAAVAGVLLALYPPAIFLDGLLEKSSLVTFFTAALLYLVATRPEQITITRSAFMGITLGLLALTRENALLLVVPLLIWTFVGRPALQERARLSLAFVGGLLAVLLPVGVRNLAAGGQFQLTTAQLGPNFYIGNHAGASGTYEALVVGHGSAADEQQDATRLAEAASGRTLSPAEVSRFWTTRALDFIRSRPGEWIALLGRKAALTFNAAEIADTETLDVYAEWSPLVKVLRFFDFGVLLGLACFGVAVASRRPWVLYAIAATYAFSVIIFYVFARYRFPIALVLMIVAASAPLVLSLSKDERRPSRGKFALALVVAAAAVAFSHLPLENARASRATHYAGIASAMANDPARRDQAMEFYRRALDEAPQFPAAQYGAGVLLARAGRHAEAVPHYRAALESWPDWAEARYNLGLALAAIGQPEEASRQLQETVRIRPEDDDAHLALGKALLAIKRDDLALAEYQFVAARQPRNAKALVGAGVALTELGRSKEAIDVYQRALESNPNDADAHNNLGWTLAREGHISEALPHFERAVALDPGDVSARRNLEQARGARK